MEGGVKTVLLVAGVGLVAYLVLGRSGALAPLAAAPSSGLGVSPGAAPTALPPGGGGGSGGAGIGATVTGIGKSAFTAFTSASKFATVAPIKLGAKVITTGVSTGVATAKAGVGAVVGAGKSVASSIAGAAGDVVGSITSLF